MSWVIRKKAVPTPKPCSKIGAKKSHLTDDGLKTLCGKPCNEQGWAMRDRDLPQCGICTKSATGYTRVARYL